MKKYNTTYNKKFFIITSVIIVALGIFIFLWNWQGLGKIEETAIPPDQIIDNLSAGLYAVYPVRSREDQQKVDIYLTNTKTGKKKLIYNLHLSPTQNSPRFFKYNEDAILICGAGSNGKNILLDLRGGIIENFVNPGCTNFVFSPNKSKIAYLDYLIEHGDSKPFIIIKDIITSEKKILSASVEQTEGILNPLAWTPDEKSIYANIVPKIQGNIYGLVQINSETLETKRNKIVDDLKLTNLSFDESLNVYGIKIDDWPEATTFYKVSSLDNSVSQYNLRNSQIDFLTGMNKSGEYLVYYSQPDNGSFEELWVYDVKNQLEKKLTDAVVSNSIWQNIQLLFVEQLDLKESDFYPSYAIKIYDALTNEIETIETINPPSYIDEIFGLLKVENSQKDQKVYRYR